MINVRPATREDIYAAAQNPMPIFQDGSDHTSGCLHCLVNGQLYALIDNDGNLCGVMGGYLIWGGVASVGALFTPHLTKYRVASIRTVTEVIELVGLHLNLHRMELAVQSDYKTGHRWAKALGFEPEGTLKMYGPNKQDHVMYGRTQWQYQQS